MKIQQIKTEIIRLVDAGLIPPILPSLDTKASELREILKKSRETSLWQQRESEMLFWGDFNDSFFYHNKLNAIKFWEALLEAIIGAVPDGFVDRIPLNCPGCIKIGINLGRLPKNYIKQKTDLERQQQIEEFLQSQQEPETGPEPEPEPEPETEPETEPERFAVLSNTAKLARRERFRALINQRPIPKESPAPLAPGADDWVEIAREEYEADTYFKSCPPGGIAAWCEATNSLSFRFIHFSLVEPIYLGCYLENGQRPEDALENLMREIFTNPDFWIWRKKVEIWEHQFHALFKDMPRPWISSSRYIWFFPDRIGEELIAVGFKDRSLALEWQIYFKSRKVADSLLLLPYEDCMDLVKVIRDSYHDFPNVIREDDNNNCRWWLLMRSPLYKNRDFAAKVVKWLSKFNLSKEPFHEDEDHQFYCLSLRDLWKNRVSRYGLTGVETMRDFDNSQFNLYLLAEFAPNLDRRDIDAAIALSNLVLPPPLQDVNFLLAEILPDGWEKSEDFEGCNFIPIDDSGKWRALLLDHRGPDPISEDFQIILGNLLFSFELNHSGYLADFVLGGITDSDAFSLTVVLPIRSFLGILADCLNQVYQDNLPKQLILPIAI